MIKRNKGIYGIGVNDADYSTMVVERLPNGKQKVIWKCPFYTRWHSMFARSYSVSSLEHRPSYKGCTVSEEWHKFSNFRDWMIKQDWEGNHLDKDLLVNGNKVYGEEYCVFISPDINSFLLEATAVANGLPVGASWHKRDEVYQSYCNNPFTNKREHLGYFNCPWEAHKAWLARKLEHAHQLAKIQTNPLVAAALIFRYENYGRE